VRWAHETSVQLAVPGLSSTRRADRERLRGDEVGARARRASSPEATPSHRRRRDEHRSFGL